MIMAMLNHDHGSMIMIMALLIMIMMIMTLLNDSEEGVMIVLHHPDGDCAYWALTMQMVVLIVLGKSINFDH